MDNPIWIKVIVVGDMSVGKTSLINQFCFEKFVNTIPTIGTEY